MSLLDAIQQKKNKLQTTETKESAVHLGTKDDEEKLQSYIHRVREVDIDAWYDALKNVTYDTKFLPISKEEAYAFLEAFDCHKHSKEIREPHRGILNEIAVKLDQIFAEWKGHGAFVKISSRSPKDASIASNRTIDLFNKFLSESTEKDDNAKLIAINRAHILALKSMSGKEAVELLSVSERIFEDLTLALDDKTKWSQNIIIREWIDIPIEFEFRGFVRNGKLNAVCQYYHSCYFPELVNNKNKIESLILDFFENVLSPILTVKTAIVDFAVDLPNSKVYVIELNPYNDYEGCGTSAAMFDWKADRDVLDNGPFEFRMEMKPIENLSKLLGSQWRQLFKEV